jgi:hypothetical protein
LNNFHGIVVVCLTILYFAVPKGLLCPDEGNGEHWQKLQMVGHKKENWWWQKVWLMLRKCHRVSNNVFCRYRAVDSSSTREDWFYDYVKSLKEEKKEKSHKDKDSDRHSKGETKDDDKKESDQNVSSLTNNTKEGEEETDEKNSYDEDNEKVSARVNFQLG